MSDARLPAGNNTTLSRRTFIHAAGAALAPIATCLTGYAAGKEGDTEPSVASLSPLAEAAPTKTTQ